MMLSNKYKPLKLDDLFMNKEHILQIKRLALERKHVIINGPSGSGKTSAVYALANDLGYEILELNSSEQRNKNNLELVLGPGSKEGSLFSKGRLILVDDVEALSGTKDRGGLLSLISFVSESKWPIVFTTSNIHDFKFSKLKSKCSLIELDKVNDLDIFNLLRKICEKEDIVYDPLILKELAERSKGDIRSAINDLQVLSIDKQLASLENLDEREREQDILNALKNVFKLNEINKVLNSFNDTNINLDEAVLWVDENLPREYLDKGDLVRAYDSLSKSDVFKGRIIRWQYWRFLVYRNFFLTAGVSLAKNNEYLSSRSYKRSGRLLKLYWAKMRGMKKKAIAAKIAKKCHCSSKKALREFFPYVQLIYKQGQEINLELSKEEIEYMGK